jgi:hypothetical protein
MEAGAVMANFVITKKGPDNVANLNKPKSAPGPAPKYNITRAESPFVGPPDPDPVDLARETALKERAEEIGPFQAAAIGAGEGLVTFLRGVGFMDPATGIEKEAMAALEEESPIAVGGGRMVGEAAIPVGAAVLTGGIGGMATQVPLQAGIGAIEGGVLARGRGEDVGTGAGIGGTIAGASEVLFPVLGRLGGALFRRLKGTAPTAPVIDAAGKPSQELLEALDEAGMTFDQLVEEASQQAGGEVSGEAVEEVAEGLGKTAAKKKVTGSMVEELAEQADPSPSILLAADKLGLKETLLPSHTAQNPVFIAVEQGLKSIPGSQLAIQEKKVIEELAQRADDFILEFGGNLDKAAQSADFTARAQTLVKGLEEKADAAYTKIREVIPSAARVDATNVLDFINKRITELDGAQNLTAAEKKILKKLGGEKKPTYALLEEVRQDIGAGFKGGGPFKDSRSGLLSLLYGKLAQDQKAAAAQFGAEKLYETASSLVSTRKGIEDQLTQVLGRNVSGSIMNKARPAILNLQKGDTTAFRELVENIPEALGEETKLGIVVSALNDAFVQGSRKEKSLNVAGFDDFMKGLNRNPTAKKELQGVIGEEAINRLDLLHKVIGGVRRAQEDAITTGRVMSVPGMLDEQKGLVARLYGTVQRAAELGQRAPSPGARVAGATAEALIKSKTPRSEAADKLLANPKFADVIRAAVAGKLDTAAKRKTAEGVVINLPAYKKWLEKLPAEDARKAATLGAIGYFTGEGEE